ncbi:MAG: hypothetical protein ACI8Z1_000287 [Candidatus Azotimanducaceae bacterium]|jgi:hypothetical protein
MGLAMITIEELAESSQEISLLRVRSFDPSIYLVEVEIDDTCYRVTDKAGEPLKFRGLTAAKRAFAGLPIKDAVLVHESAYDEMVGLPESEGKRMEVRISVPAE